MTNLNNNDTTTVDSRGNTWRSTHVGSETQQTLETVRRNWENAHEDAIASAKKLIVNAFDDNTSGVKGMACSDFIYIFNDSGCEHYFLRTDPAKTAMALKYNGECDMFFASMATFDDVLMQRDIG